MRDKNPRFSLGPTNGVSQCKIIALSGKDGEEASLAETSLWAGNKQRQGTHNDKHCHFGNEDAPQKGPDDIAKVQQHHVLKEQGGQRKLGHKVPQALGLHGGDDIRSPSTISTQNDPEALHQRWEETINGHSRRGRRRVVGCIWTPSYGSKVLHGGW
ncbi:hypothetical protein AAFF_G00327560 [Aldrovandia affinis]|uniref:Uncharacterized protein n=1 Tax=Aldrovandia affinis TaxID=143900 RepID=A0AAD7X1N0_9TELE|nr:hypothetical protein AAFF_G00327560 [Aldrovandia affinis]